MSKINCHIIQDLLPLYIDEACSNETVKAVEEHLNSCEDCMKLYTEMNAEEYDTINMLDFNSKAVFKNIGGKVLGIILALAIMISCFVINAGRAWEGGTAGFSHFTATLCYVIFWGVFSVISRKYKPLANLAFVISLLTAISSINGLMWNLLGKGGFIVAFISIFTSIPFYGLRWIMGWTELYATATVLSVGWLIYTGNGLKKFEKDMKVK